MAGNRDFLYSSLITGLRCFVTDDNQVGLHLTKLDGETLDVVFRPEGPSGSI
jgi:hypothetical protein